MKTKITTLLTVLLFCLSATAMAQKITISGKVTDANTGEELPGVTISVKGTNTGVATDFDGNYKIELTSKGTLVYSYIGYKTQSVKVTESKVINIALQEDSHTLDEMVVLGYTYEKKSMLTGSVQSVAPMYNGRVAGIQIDRNSEEYGSFTENRFKSPLEEALSTFSIDVDGASYTNFRRFVNQGQKTPKDAVRVEEFINYFKYNYDQPTEKDPVKMTTEIGECPWAPEHRLVRIGVKAKEIAKENLPASNMVFLIDVSGSMYGPTRLDLVKSSMKLLTNNLRDNDRVAIVVYSGNAGLVLPSTSGSNKQAIIDALESLTAGGSTAGGAGIQLAYKIAKENFIKGGNNRIILCSDGDFNVGVSSAKGLEELIEQERKSGVFLSILGYGMGNYKDDRMQVLAQKGNGNASYIDNLQEANRVLVQEFGGTLFTVAKDVKLQIEFNPAYVQAYRLVGYESRLLNKEDFNDDTKDAGEMGAGHTVTALYEIIPVGVNSNIYAKVDDLKYQKVKKNKDVALNNSPETCTVKLRYKQPDGDKSVKMEIPVVDNKKNNVSSDMKFASAVAMFGQLIKDSDYKGTASYDKVIALAKSGLGDDDNGYRREFVRLAETAQGLQ